MKIKKIEELECWKEARKLVNMIYSLTKKERFSRDYRLRDQITGSGISIMNNIAEGFDAQSNNEFIRFLTISRRENSEATSCLYVSLDQGYITELEFNETKLQAEKVKMLIDGFLRYLRSYRKSKLTKQTQPTKRT
jgi:four helix bundle protein